jgi:hypothetical protein
MLRMFAGSDTDLFHCVAAFLSVDREKAFGSHVIAVEIVLLLDLSVCRAQGVLFHADCACFQRRICFVEAV